MTSLKELHESLCHPGVTRLAHYVKIKKLPFSIKDVKIVVQDCKDCSEIKASFLKLQNSINHATQSFERKSVDYKGLLQSGTNNQYLFVIVDEFSRFPFVYLCNNMKACTVIKKLTDLFCMLGFPNYLHGDQDSSLMSYELKSWLHTVGIPISKRRDKTHKKWASGTIKPHNLADYTDGVTFEELATHSLGIRLA